MPIVLLMVLLIMKQGNAGEKKGFPVKTGKVGNYVTNYNCIALNIIT